MANLRDQVVRSVTAVHRTMFDVTNGRLGGKTMGMPTLKLVTTGRKSGKRRETMLTAPIVDDETVVLVASYGGAPHHPDWYHNLCADPNVVITLHGQTRNMLARVVDSDEKALLWERITTVYKGYADYQTRTDREIPVVILEPAG